MKGANRWLRVIIFQKIFVWGKWTILGPKMVHLITGSAIRIFLKFCPVNWANRQMKVIMVCTKEFCSGQIGVFWARKWHICINLDWLYRKSVQKEHTVKRCLIILDLKPLRSQVKGKHFIGREFQSLVVQGKKLLTQTSL